MRTLVFIATSASLLLPLRIGAQSRTPSIRYAISIDSTALDVAEVSIAIRNAPKAFRLAMKAHPEYDAKYWRYVDSFTVDETTDNAAAKVTRVDSTLWNVILPGGSGVVHYRVHVQPSPEIRRGWQPFMRATGGLINGPDFLLYLPDFANVPVTLRLTKPASWKSATSLAQDPATKVYRAPNVAQLLDSPILLGNLRTWTFTEPLAQGTGTFHIAYWPLPNATPFDSTAFVRAVKSLTHETLALFGKRMPSREYWFLFQDGADDALEHRASVTMGLASELLARDQRTAMSQLAHEFVHTWNLVAIRPEEYGKLSYAPTKRTSTLWFGEGITLYYADALTRRARVVDSAATRLDQLLARATQYYAASWAGSISPARASLAFQDSPITNPDATGGYYTQGELFGHVLDALIRDSTRDTRSLDDVMRAMYARSADDHGFTNKELRETVDSVCRCHTAALFASTIEGPALIDLRPALKRMGLTLIVDTAVVLSRTGTPLGDGRVTLDFTGKERGPFQLIVSIPSSPWYAAGLRTGDTLVSLNGKPVVLPSDFRPVIRGLMVGDTVRAVVKNGGGERTVNVVIPSYSRARVRIVESPDATPVEQARLARWLRGW